MRRGKSDEAVIQSGQWVWRVRPEFADRASGIEKRIVSASRSGARAVKETGGRRTIWTMPLSRDGKRTAFVKHYSRPRFAKQLKHLVRNSRTRQEWEMGLRLEELGVPVARHLAMGERRVAGLLQEDYLVQEYLEGYKNFDEWFREDPGSEGSGVKERRRAIEKLADLIRLMHDHGVLQRDFKPDSIMVGPEGDYRVVDLERVLIVPWRGGLSRARRIANLAKVDQTFGFIGSMADRVFFLRRYFKDAELAEGKFERIAAEIGGAAERSFRQRAREVMVWTRTDNETYHRREIAGARVCAHYTLHEKFLRSVITDLAHVLTRELVCLWEPRIPGAVFRLRALPCNAMSALALSPYLYYRKVPFVPGRAAILPGPGSWGIFLQLVPDPPLPAWVEGAERSRREGREFEFGRELGASLRVFHRMGITLGDLQADSLLYDPGHDNPLLRFYLNRLDRLVVDRTPGPMEAKAALESVIQRLEFGGEAARGFEQAYSSCRLRWFPGVDRW